MMLPAGWRGLHAVYTLYRRQSD